MCTPWWEALWCRMPASLCYLRVSIVFIQVHVISGELMVSMLTNANSIYFVLDLYITEIVHKDSPMVSLDSIWIKYEPGKRPWLPHECSLYRSFIKCEFEYRNREMFYLQDSHGDAPCSTAIVLFCSVWWPNFSNLEPMHKFHCNMNLQLFVIPASHILLPLPSQRFHPKT